MRIMHVVHGFPPAATGGTELYAHDLTMALSSQSQDQVFVLTRDSTADRPEFSVRWEQQNSVQVAYINNTYKLCRSFEQTYRHDGVRNVASDLMDHIRPEVAHLHHLTGLSTDLVSEISRRNVPTFFTLHDYWLLCQRGQLLDLDYKQCAGPSPARCAVCVGTAAGAGPATFQGASLLRSLEVSAPASARLLRKLATRLSAMWADPSEARNQMQRRLSHIRNICSRVTCFLAPSQTVRHRFLDFGIRQDLIHHSALGVNHSRFADLSRRRDHEVLRLGFLGSLMPSKGPHLLLKAFARLPAGAASLALMGDHVPYHGDESYRGRLTPLMDRADVQHLGALPHDQVPKALSSLDVLVVPSIWMENAPLVVREAFLAGVVVVASRLGGLAEIISDGVNGLLFEPGDSNHLRQKLQRLLDEPQLLDRLRAGIPGVRTIEDDALSLRELYRQSLPASKRLVCPDQMVSRRPRMAAVVLNYGTPKDTEESVLALQASRRPIDDLIVVDNGSEDGSEAYLREALSGVTILQTGENLGFSGGNNVALRFALRRGADQVLLVNSDVTLAPDCAGQLERALRQSPENGIAGPSVLARSDPNIVASLGIAFSSTTGRMLHLGFGQQFKDLSLPPSTSVDGVSGCAMMIKREVLERVGLLSEEYFFSFEDLDICLRARQAGFTSICVSDAIALHEGGRSIGKHSPRRIYFATRNHLLMTRLAADSPLPFTSPLRSGFILGLNLAHVLLTSETTRSEGLKAMLQGIWHYMWRRYGNGP